MTTLHFKLVDEHKYTECIEEHTLLDLQHFAERCEQSPEWVLKLIEFDILKKTNDEKIYLFSEEDLMRARQAFRLQRDFDASFSAVAMMLDLIEELKQLRRDVKHAQFKH